MSLHSVGAVKEAKTMSAGCLLLVPPLQTCDKSHEGAATAPAMPQHPHPYVERLPLCFPGTAPIPKRTPTLPSSHPPTHSTAAHLPRHGHELALLQLHTRRRPRPPLVRAAVWRRPVAVAGQAARGHGRRLCRNHRQPVPPSQQLQPGGNSCGRCDDVGAQRAQAFTTSKGGSGGGRAVCGSACTRWRSSC